MLAAGVFVVLRRRAPAKDDYVHFEQYCAENRYEKSDFGVLAPEILKRSHYLSRRGRYSLLYTNSSRRLRHIAALTRTDHRNSYGVLPEYTVFMVEGKATYCDHCLAFPRKSRESRAFAVIHGEGFNTSDRHPDIRFYSVEPALPEKTVQIVADIIGRLELKEIGIECFGPWLMVVIPQIPDRRTGAGIFDVLQFGNNGREP